jgi:hypothetical protein
MISITFFLPSIYNCFISRSACIGYKEKEEMVESWKLDGHMMVAVI